ncbi:MFS transporter [Granulicella sibirica]|uniref:Putative glucarate transporter n=1 Tax=Granulicella sibirica TaxID=2479048 RepID=A0A4Q0T2X3_9BACT|nr:MFS transporter [Granulicella sibirica]RXH57587.1 putative glucarate transporter [Granulicella sibirica]
MKGRGFTEAGLLLACLPFLVAAAANFCGGFLSEALTRRLGLKWGRRWLGCFGLGSAALLLTAAMLTEQRMWSLVFLSLSFGAITLQQPGVLAVCLDLGGRRYAGAVTGAMNTATFLSAFVSSIAYGYIVKGYGYNAPFVPMIGLLVVGSGIWFGIDATREVVVEV